MRENETKEDEEMDKSPISSSNEDDVLPSSSVSASATPCENKEEKELIYDETDEDESGDECGSECEEAYRNGESGAVGLSSVEEDTDDHYQFREFPSLAQDSHILVSCLDND